MNETEFLNEAASPRWIKDVFRFLPVKSQFLLSGNIRDRYPFPLEAGKHLPLRLQEYLANALALRGYRYFLLYNPIDGFSVVTPRGGHEAEARKFFADQFGLGFAANGRAEASLLKSLETIERVTTWQKDFVAVFCDFASRYLVRLDSPTDNEHNYFTKALMLGHSVEPHVTEQARTFSQFNPIFWICDKENDLPGWLGFNNPRLRAIVVPRPDHVMRRAMIGVLLPSLAGHKDADEAERRRQASAFVDQTEGMGLTDVIAITQLCRREGLPLAEIGEGVRRYKLGVTEDPWRRIPQEKIAKGADLIHERVKGQHQAVVKALDIIKRAAVGLSGSQGTRLGGRPRGVMFLAGATGVGKTELAKALTELLFADERAMIRFDMSEFSAEHADQRLLGAPPGYVGYDAGGELTNAIRENPFSVVLFDEIEKAHPRILDKFLQLLDDGVLTSGRGERVYFSESVIVFTSNLGIFKLDPSGRRVPNVIPSDPFPEVERKVRSEIEQYFKTTINRPEILNRIGENIVIFDFIRDEIAEQIFQKMIRAIVGTLTDRQKIILTLAPEAEAELRRRCTEDLANGGRGIGNQIEAWFTKPLARALFDQGIREGASVTVAALSQEEGIPTVKLVATAAAVR